MRAGVAAAHGDEQGGSRGELVGELAWRGAREVEATLAHHLDHYANGAIEVRSAGSAPGEQINPAVADILTERGLDVTKEFPKPLTDEIAATADVLVTMGCGDACPVYPGKRYLDWQLDDPAGQSVEVVRPIVDEIDRRVQELLAELVAAPTP